jgi:hypothetical protein
MAEYGVINFGIGIHGIPVTMDYINDGLIDTPKKGNFQNKSPYLLPTNEIV